MHDVTIYCEKSKIVILYTIQKKSQAQSESVLIHTLSNYSYAWSLTSSISS